MKRLTIPEDARNLLSLFEQLYYVVFTHDDQYLIIRGRLDSSGSVQPQQPINCIYAGKSPYGSFYTLVKQFIYPLDPPWGATGKRNTT